MKVTVSSSGRVKCEASLPLPMSARRAWGQIRDFRRFAMTDHFHADLAIEGGVPRAGARLRLEHRYGPFRVRRVGRILRWREGEGFAFSDLSRRSRRVGFPHVMAIRVADAAGGCIVTLGVTGRWTAPTPRWMARLWLAWVMLEIVQRTRNELLMVQLATE